MFNVETTACREGTNAISAILPCLDIEYFLYVIYGLEHNRIRPCINIKL